VVFELISMFNPLPSENPIMPNGKDPFTRLIARVTALLQPVWLGLAGELFRARSQSRADFVEGKHLLPEDLLESGMELAGRKITGLANQEFAAVQKNLAEAGKASAETEDTKIEVEIKKRTLEIEINKKEAEAHKTEAEARKANAEASLVEIQSLDAQYELAKKLAESGMVLVRDERGKFSVLPKRADSDLLPPLA